MSRQSMLNSSIKRSNNTPGKQFALCNFAADRSQASAKHDLSTWDKSSPLMGRVVGAGIFVVPSTLARTLIVERLNYSHTDLFACRGGNP
jgi:hypothetical protein